VTNIVSVSSKGQATIPLWIRQDLGIQAGDKLIFDLKKDRIVARPIKESFLDLMGAFKVKGPVDWQKVRKQVQEVVAWQAIKRGGLKLPKKQK